MEQRDGKVFFDPTPHGFSLDQSFQLELAIRLHGEFSVDLEELWMTFEEFERRQIKQALRIANRAVFFSVRGGQIIGEQIIFPTGYALRRLSRLTGERAREFLLPWAAEPGADGVGPLVWGQALRVLRDRLQEEFMAPAYWAAQSKRQWNRLLEKVQPAQDVAVDAASLRFGVGADAPAMEETEVAIDFELADELVEDWKIEGGRSALLDAIVTAADETDFSLIDAPAFPGGLFDEHF